MLYFGWRYKIITKFAFDNFFAVISKSIYLYIIPLMIIGLSTYFINYPPGLFIDTFTAFEELVVGSVFPVWLLLIVAALIYYWLKKQPESDKNLQ